jgi:hypothetical protein
LAAILLRRALDECGRWIGKLNVAQSKQSSTEGHGFSRAVIDAAIPGL